MKHLEQILLNSKRVVKNDKKSPSLFVHLSVKKEPHNVLIQQIEELNLRRLAIKRTYLKTGCGEDAFHEITASQIKAIVLLMLHSSENHRLSLLEATYPSRYLSSKKMY